MGENGNLPAADLTPIAGGQLRHDAAGAWLAMREHIGKSKNVWICPTSPRTSYRPFADQQFFWNVYQRDGRPIAAKPGTSNHGWGIAVDVPTGDMQAAIREVGDRFGWGIRGGKLSSDAPSEPWHCTFHPGVYKGPVPQKREHPYKYMTDQERTARDTLLKERTSARRHGGWKQIDDSHRKRASEAKKELRQYAVNLRTAAKESGWEKNHRKERFDYINKLIGGTNGKG
jgi:hypothetical protein